MNEGIYEKKIRKKYLKSLLVVLRQWTIIEIINDEENKRFLGCKNTWERNERGVIVMNHDATTTTTIFNTKYKIKM